MRLKIHNHVQLQRNAKIGTSLDFRQVPSVWILVPLWPNCLKSGQRFYQKSYASLDRLYIICFYIKRSWLASWVG